MRGFAYAKKFDWKLYPKTEKFLQQQINTFLRNNKHAQKLAKRMQGCSTSFIDWMDHIVLPKTYEPKLKELGYKKSKKEAPEGVRVYENQSSVFFPILIHKDTIECVLKPEVLNQFAKGKAFAPYRKAIVHKEGKNVLSAVERRGYGGFVVTEAEDIPQYRQALQEFRKRKRRFKTDRQGIVYTQKQIHKVLKTLSPSRTADAFFRAEREYWQKRNRAGQVQKARQDALKLGWGNHDHHTYRSSRDNFMNLVSIFESMGFQCRERFYAGEQSGWGAQILEHPDCDIVLFCDVDLDKGDHHRDFAHRGFNHPTPLDTVGLWVALHGESVLQAGMHHLEARFNFNQLRRDLKKKKIDFMAPFSHFPFLKQAFSKGEQWTVEKARLDSLLKAKQISDKQYQRFRKQGAIGSHLENLQRRQGFKGFNQHSVSAIINLTDPLKQIRGA